MNLRAFSAGRIGVAVAVSVYGLLTAMPAAFSQQALEEVTVTAQKRAQRQEDVGIAVTALSGDQIKELGLRDLTDIAAQTPSLSVAAPFGSSGNQNFTLRGVGLNDFSEHNESPVAAYQDGVYQATIAGINAALFDVDRIEVLRGPQGTLYGRNSTGGLVQFFSKQPTASWDGFAKFDYGSYSQKRFEGAIGGPITDTLLFRVSGLYDHNNGWGPSTVAGVEPSNGSNQLGGRIMLKWLASEDTSVLLNVHAATNHATGPAYTPLSTMYAPDGVTQIATPPNVVNPTCANVFGLTGPGQDCFGYRDMHSSPWVFDNNRQSFQDLDTNGVSATVDSKVFGLDLTSITAYEHVHKLYGEDTDGGPAPGIAVTNPVESKEMTQELRLSNKSERLFWTAGLYYFYRDISAGSDTNVSGVGFVDDDFRDQLRSKSAAVFGQLEYAITSQFTLIGGLRFSHEDQSFSLLSVDHTGLTPAIRGITPYPVPDYNVFPFTAGPTADLTPYRDSRADNLVTYRGEVNYKPTEDFLLYGSISKGTKSAGWNGAIDGSGLLGVSTPDKMPYAPENLLAYEVGFKQLMRGIYRLNGAVFYYDYKDFQAFTFTGLTQQIGNLPASVQGAELELVITPDDHLDLTLGGSYLSTRVKGVVTPVVGSSATVTESHHMVLAPNFSLNGIARYHFRVAGERELAFQIDSHYTGRQYFDLDNDPIATEKGHAVTNASISFTDPGTHLTASLWVKNLTDRRYRLYAIPVTSLGFEQQMYGPPRWYGVSLGYNW
jgi:iron complex outermembrane receptor protein